MHLHCADKSFHMHCVLLFFVFTMLRPSTQGIHERLTCAMQRFPHPSMEDEELAFIASFFQLGPDMLHVEMWLLHFQTSLKKATTMTTYNWFNSLKKYGLVALHIFCTIHIISSLHKLIYLRITNVRQKLRSTMSQEWDRWLMLPFTKQGIAASM